MASLRFKQVVWFVVAVVLVVWSSCGDAQGSSRRSQGSRRRQGNRNPARRGGLSQSLHHAYLSAMDATTASPDGAGGTQTDRQVSNPRWRHFTPNLPDPDEIECHMDILFTETYGGKCIKLGSTMSQFACQAGSHLRINNQCGAIVTARELAAAQQTSPDQD